MFVPSSEEPDAHFEMINKRDTLIDFLKSFLTWKEIEVIDLRFGFGLIYDDYADQPLTFREIGAIKNLSGQTINVRVKKAVEKINEKLRSMGVRTIDEYYMMI